MDFAKLVSLLEKRTLTFARADKFEDTYEGALSSPSILALKKQGEHWRIPDLHDKIWECSQNTRTEMFLSCWHASEHESAALWKTYMQSSEGIAIQTDSRLLEEALHSSPLYTCISMVRYVNYASTAIPAGDVISPFVFKRMSFSHERELRALIWRIEERNSKQISPCAEIVEVDLDLPTFIKSVHVAPTAAPWFGQLVEQVLKRYGILCPTIRSSLYSRPAY